MLWFVRLRRLLKATGRDALILFHACREPGVPKSVKVLSVLMLLYLFSPFDLVPDFAVIFGVADDLAVLMLGIPFLLKKVPTDIVQRAAAKADQTLGRWGFGTAADVRR